MEFHTKCWKDLGNHTEPLSLLVLLMRFIGYCLWREVWIISKQVHWAPGRLGFILTLVVVISGFPKKCRILKKTSWNIRVWGWLIPWCIDVAEGHWWLFMVDRCWFMDSLLAKVTLCSLLWNKTVFLVLVDSIIKSRWWLWYTHLQSIVLNQFCLSILTKACNTLRSNRWVKC